VNWFWKDASGLLGSTLENEGTTFPQNFREHTPMSASHPTRPESLTILLFQLQISQVYRILKTCAFYEGSSVGLVCDTLYDTI